MAKEKKSSRKPVDYPRLRDLIKKARGDRTLSQYAADAGVDHAVLYKIMNNDDYKPGLSVLQRLGSDSANPQGGVSLTDLMAAAGFPIEEMKLYSSMRNATGALGGIVRTIPVIGAPIAYTGMLTSFASLISNTGRLKHLSSEKEQEQVALELSNYVKEQTRFKAMATGLIFSTLASKGIVFQPGNMQSIDTFGFRPDDYINIFDQVIDCWWFRFGNLLPNNGDYPIRYEEQASAIFQQIVTAKPDPRRKISFVMDDPNIFECLKRYAKHNSYRGNLSVILIDIENVAIRDEELLSTYNETTEKDPLSIM